MADYYNCIVCQTRVKGLSDLHLHQTNFHSINQLSLALLTCHGFNNKTQENLPNDDNNNMKKNNSRKCTLQEELLECKTALDKVLPDKIMKEGRRKKNPKPRRNCKRAPRKKASNFKGDTSPDTSEQHTKFLTDLNVQTSKMEELKPIQQPHLSSTISTPIAPKRTLRKKSLVNYYDLPGQSKIECNNNVNKNSVVQNKQPSVECAQKKIRGKNIVNHSNKRSLLDKNSPMLKTILDKTIQKCDRIHHNITEPTKYKHLQPKYKIDNEQNYQFQENITWNRVYQNYVDGFESLRESMQVQENYIMIPNNDGCGLSDQQHNEKSFVTQTQLPQLPQMNVVTEGTYQCNQYLQYYPIIKPIDVSYYSQEKTIANEYNKNYAIDPANSWKTPEPVESYNEDSNLDNLNTLSLNLTSDVKDIIVEFLAQEENARTKNPFWEDNMDKYFPSETESSSEIEQFNDTTENPYEYNDAAPLNLVVTQSKKYDKYQQCNCSNINTYIPLVGSKGYAKCKSTWSSEYNKYRYDPTGNNNTNCEKSAELSTAYKHKMHCLYCGEGFHNEDVLTVHITNCMSRIKENNFDNSENANILDQHIYQTFCVQNNNQNVATSANLMLNKKEANVQNNYQCYTCNIGFSNRTKYCKHMLSHKRKSIQSKEMLCFKCGLLFGSNALPFHLRQCA